MKLKSSLDLNPALNLKWKPVAIANKIGHVTHYAEEAICGNPLWLRLKESKILLHYFPFVVVPLSEMGVDFVTREATYTKDLIFEMVPHRDVVAQVYDVNKLIIDGRLDWDCLEYALVPRPENIGPWHRFEIMRELGDENLPHKSGQKAVLDEGFFLETPDESKLVFLWPHGDEPSLNMTIQPYFFREFYGDWRSLYSHQDEYYDVKELQEGDRWIYMFGTNVEQITY